MYEVIFYKDRQGEEPVKEYLYDLLARGRTSKRERVLAKKIIAYIKALQQYGTRIGVPTVKHIDGKLWELRLSTTGYSFSTGRTTFLYCCITSSKKPGRRLPRRSTRLEATLPIFWKGMKNNEENRKHGIHDF